MQKETMSKLQYALQSLYFGIRNKESNYDGCVFSGAEIVQLMHYCLLSVL